jgi:hypothetical protein
MVIVGVTVYPEPVSITIISTTCPAVLIRATANAVDPA